MPTVNQTAPGVYLSISDVSFTQPAVSRFRPGLIGVASKGPFNTPTAVRTLKEFRRVFGRPITTTYLPSGAPDGPGFFLADAVGIITNASDGATVVRVGNQYGTQVTSAVSGVEGHLTFGTSQAAMLDQPGDVFVRITEAGKDSTVNAPVVSVSGTVVTLESPLADTYANGAVAFSTEINAANKAEAVLYGYTWTEITSAGSVVGNKNDFQFVAQSATNIEVGKVYKIEQTDKTSTQEVRVKTKLGNTVYLEASDLTRVGYQALPLQDTYPSAAGTAKAKLYAASGTEPLLWLEAASEGAWANGELPTAGLFVAVRPGSGPNTKKLEVYEDGALVEVFDNLANTAGNNWYETRINGANNEGISQYVRISNRAKYGHPANTVAPWDSAFIAPVNYTVRAAGATNRGFPIAGSVTEDGVLLVTGDLYVLIGQTEPSENGVFRVGAPHVRVAGGPIRVAVAGGNTYANKTYDIDVDGVVTEVIGPVIPGGRINAGYPGSGSSFANGFNGENAQESDFIGTVDVSDDSLTGIKAFEDADNLNVNILVAPQNFDADTAGRPIMQELARVAKKIKALAIADIPAGTTGRAAIDWHRGLGLFTGKGTVDSANLEVFWNWFRYIDPFTGLLKLVPPTLGVLEAMARTFDTDKPWKAVAGETRGVISALSLEFPVLAEEVRQAMSAEGNSVNPILRMRGRSVIYGERTMQIADSKLLAGHNVILVNFIVTSLGELGRRYVFDPNDPELLVQINLAFSDFMERLKNEGGVEDYNLIINKQNNTPETRNQRQVIVDLSVIPTDVMERMFIRCAVMSSGADLLSVTA